MSKKVDLIQKVKKHCLKVSALALPYKGLRLSMIVLLPDSDCSLKNLEDALVKVPEAKSVLKNLRLPENIKEIDVYLPKFKIEKEWDLKNVFEKLDITDMFDVSEADFSKMTNGTKGLFVSEVIQKAFIEVNEEGSEAAAATFADVGIRAQVEPLSFECDRPFMFLIMDNQTGITLFSGHFAHPN